MQGLDPIEIPPERGDRLRIAEQRLRQDVALALIGLEPSSIQDRAGEQFRVPECVAYSVSGQRVLEVSGIADQRPTGTVRLPEMPGDAGEATQAAHQASATDIVAEMRRVCREDLEEGALDISAKRGREGRARHADKHTVLPVVRGDDTCRNVLRKVPVISVPLEVLIVAVDVAGCALAIEIGRGRETERRRDAHRRPRCGPNRRECDPARSALARRDTRRHTPA